MRVAVYGGTFDPPHLAHLAIARAALERGVAERVLFVPAAVPPHKDGKHITPFERRLEMLKLAVAGEPRFEVSDLEARRLPSPSYTIDTMDELAASRPSDRFVLLIGSDSLEALHAWRRAAELVGRYELAVYPRLGQVPSLEYLKERWPAETARRLHNSLLADMPQSDLSSSSLRLALANSQNAGRFTPEAVLDYIRKHGLYAEASQRIQHNPESNADGSSEEENRRD